jgi:sulfane dehydrogenase subunit SoxC
VYAANGEALRPAHGYPVRLLVPGWEANVSIKWLRRLELKDRPTMTKDETAKYTDPLPGDRARQFSFVQDAKSIITSPAHPDVLTPGFWPVQGLAWSGRGRVTRVEVSADGGKTWHDAELTGAQHPKAAVRFVHPWRWDGAPALLMSRVTDETGYVQPTYAQFRDVRGPGTDFHFNPIRSWRVAADGAVTFVADPEAA